MAYSKIKLRRGTAYDWNSINPVLEEGEIVVECPDSGVGTGLSKFKIGDGVTPYSSLPYAFDGMKASSIDGGGAERFNIIQIRGAKAATWESVNPILNSRELGFDMTNISIKVGNGKNNWNDLPFIKAGDFTGLIIDCGDEENPEEEIDIEYEEDYNQHNDQPTPSDPDAPVNPDDPEEPEHPETPETDTLSIVNENTEEVIAGSLVNGVWLYNITYPGAFDINVSEGMDRAINTRIIISTTETVKLTFNDVIIDNSALDDDTPVISTNCNENTNIYLEGSNQFIGNGSFLVTPANGVIVSNGEGDIYFYSTGNLTINDPMSSNDDYSESGCSAGVYCRGNVTNMSTIAITTNGPALRVGGTIHDNSGTEVLTSILSNAIESIGDVVFDDSTITISSPHIGIHSEGEVVIDGFATVNITAPTGIDSNGQNISDNAVVNIVDPTEPGSEYDY